MAESGRLLYQERQEISAHTHFVFVPGGMDFNVLAHFDEGFLQRKDTTIRYAVGFGWSGLTLGSFIKWIPFPDYRYQPAVGFSTGALYNALDTKTHYVNLVFRPLFSKDIETVVGKFTPYVAVPLSIRVKNFSEFDFPVRMALGLRGELFFIHFHKLDLNVEWGMGLTEGAVSYFSVGLITDWML